MNQDVNRVCRDCGYKWLDPIGAIVNHRLERLDEGRMLLICIRQRRGGA